MVHQDRKLCAALLVALGHGDAKIVGLPGPWRNASDVLPRPVAPAAQAPRIAPPGPTRRVAPRCYLLGSLHARQRSPPSGPYGGRPSRAVLIAVLLSALAMSAIVALRYFATSGAFALATSRVRPGLYAGLNPQIRREMGWSLASAAIYGVPAGIVAWGWQERGWTLIYTEWTAWPLWYLPVSLLLYLFAHDTWFYWTHRLMHRPRLFKLAHAVHHASRPPTAWAAMSFHPIEALTGALVIPALVFLLPIHVGMLGLLLAIMTVMGVTNHMGWEMFPKALVHSRVGSWLITASHHQRHHDEYRCNYGLYFRFWDRLCCTDRGISSRWAH